MVVPDNPLATNTARQGVVVKIFCLDSTLPRGKLTGSLPVQALEPCLLPGAGCPLQKGSPRLTVHYQRQLPLRVGLGQLQWELDPQLGG